MVDYDILFHYGLQDTFLADDFMLFAKYAGFTPFSNDDFVVIDEMFRIKYTRKQMIDALYRITTGIYCFGYINARTNESHSFMDEDFLEFTVVSMIEFAKEEKLKLAYVLIDFNENKIYQNLLCQLIYLNPRLQIMVPSDLVIQYKAQNPRLYINMRNRSIRRFHSVMEISGFHYHNIILDQQPERRLYEYRMESFLERVKKRINLPYFNNEMFTTSKYIMTSKRQILDGDMERFTMYYEPTEADKKLVEELRESYKERITKNHYEERYDDLV